MIPLFQGNFIHIALDALPTSYAEIKFERNRIPFAFQNTYRKRHLCTDRSGHDRFFVCVCETFLRRQKIIGILMILVKTLISPVTS